MEQAEFIDIVVDELVSNDSSSYKIGKDVGVAGETIMNYRKGKTKPSYLIAQRLGNYLGVKPDGTRPEPKEKIDLVKELSSRIDRLIDIITLQGKTIESQQRTIERLTSTPQ